MLILTLKAGESFVIDDTIKISVTRLKSSQVQLGIDAPRDIAVHRAEARGRTGHDPASTTPAND